MRNSLLIQSDHHANLSDQTSNETNRLSNDTET